MSGAELYDDLIMDHIKNARNYRALDHVDLTATGSNPLCGDELTVYLRIEHERVEEIAFQCTCCGISMASASIMTEMVKGQDAADARRLLRAFASLLNGLADFDSNGVAPGQRAILATARKYPARARCAALPWATLEEALDNWQQAVPVR